MSQIQKGNTYITGDTVSATSLNNHVDLAVLLPGAITSQSAATAAAAADTFLIHNAAATALRKITTTNLFTSCALVTPALGVPSSGTLTSCTGLPLATGVTGTLPVASGGTGTGTAFTAGSVVFAGSGGTYGQDNANLFWDDTNNRLGVGTTSPQRSLHVMGTIPVRLERSGENYLDFSFSGGAVGTDGLDLVLTPGAATSFGYKFQTYNGGLVDAFAIDKSGNVGIGTTSPSYQLQLSTDSAAKPTSSLWSIASDARIKADIESVSTSTALARIEAVRPVSFRYIPEYLDETKSEDKTYYNFIAQELEQVFPECVRRSGQKLEKVVTPEVKDGDGKTITAAVMETVVDDIASVDSHSLIIHLIAAVQELSAKVKQLESQ